MRNTSSVVQSSTSAELSDSMAEASNATIINGRRPTASDSRPASSIATAKVPVVSDNDMALPAADTPKWRLNSGSSGCTVYSRPKVEKPARNNASAVRRKAGVPCWMRVSALESTVGAAFDGRRGFASHGIDGPVGAAKRGRTGLRLGPSIQSIHNLIGHD